MGASEVGATGERGAARVAVFLPNWVGDVVMATPALRALRARFGDDARLIGVVRSPLGDLLAGTPFLDEYWAYDSYATDRRVQALRLAWRLRRERVDTVVLLTNARRSAAIAWASGAGTRVGYARDRRSVFLTHAVPPTLDASGGLAPEPAVTSYLRLAAAAGCDPRSSRRLELATSVDDERLCDEALEGAGIPDGAGHVVFQCGAAFGPAKLWPAEYFGALGPRVATELGLAVVVLAGPAEGDVVRAVVDAAAHPRVRGVPARYVSLGVAKAVVRRARAMVTTDSGPRHFAAAFGVPVVTLFGPTAIVRSETGFEKAVHVQLALECSPCQQRRCPLAHHRCMRELDVEQVYAAVEAQLARWPRGDDAAPRRAASS